MRSTALISDALSINSSTNSLENSSSAAFAIIQGLMDGFGWHNPSSSIREADAKQQSSEQKLATAIKFYLEEQDADNHSRLIAALNETLQAAQFEYDHAIKQQQYYQEQATIEAEQKSAGTSSYLGQWRHWIYDGLQNFFGSTNAQQIEKNQQIVSDQHLIIKNILYMLKNLQEINNEGISIDSSNEKNISLINSSTTKIQSGYFPAIFNLSNLNGFTGFRINGELIGDGNGWSVNGFGDINGDGYADLLIGAVNITGSDNAFNLIPRSYVIFGGVDVGNKGQLDLASLNGTNGFKLLLDDLYTNGISVSFAGDVNKDGYMDLIIGAPNINSWGTNFVVFGSEDIGKEGVINLLNLNGMNGFQITNNDNLCQIGYSVSKAGDINGDKFDDLLIGCGYRVNLCGYVIFGEAGIGKGGILYTKDLNGTNGFNLYCENNGQAGGWWWEGIGHAVSGTGDINGDNYLDFMINDRYFNKSDEFYYQAYGRTYVVFGNSTLGSSGYLNLANLNGSNGFKIDGELCSQSGFSIDGTGDLNNDGYNDFLIGAPRINSDGCSGLASVGLTYVVFGGVKLNALGGYLNLSSLNGENGFKIFGEPTTNGFFGYSVTGAGDINGDGNQDIIIGAPEYTNYSEGWRGGRSYVIFGGSKIGNNGSVNLTVLDGVIGFKIDAKIYPSFSGASVNSGGDFNGDGVDDLIIGAPNYKYLTSPQSYLDLPGHSYVVFGDIPPVLTTNSLNLFRGESVLLNFSYLAAYDKNHDNGSLVFIPVNTMYGHFASTDQENIILANFTQQQLTDYKIQFIHDGSLNSPSYDMIVRSSGIAWVGPESAKITFNPAPIILVNNQVLINQNQTVQLTTDNLLAICNNIADPNLIFTITNITHGSFILENNIVQFPLVTFTQQTVYLHAVSFVHDGSPYAPEYRVLVNDASIQTDPIFANITFNAIPIVLTHNQMLINQTQTISLTSENLLASRNNISDPDFLFVITNIIHGIFSTAKNLQQWQAINFTQQEILDKTVFFSQDGSPYAPEYQVSVNDGWNQTKPVSAQIIFNNIPFALVNNQLSIKQNEALLLSSKELLASRENYADPNFNFVITNINHGFFIANQQKSNDKITFPQQAILSGNVTFTHDGSMSAPGYWVAVNDGWNQTIPQIANITFFLKPVLAINQFLVSLGQSIILSLNNLCANDCYDETFDQLQFNLIGETSGGQFEDTSNPGQALARFTQKNVKQNQIKFISNGLPTAPRYQLEVMDPDTSLTDSSIGSTLLVTRNYLPINQNQIFYLTPNNLNVTSSSGLDADIIFTPVENTVHHGYFALASNPSAPLATFKQDQINKNQIFFVSDDSAIEPSGILSVRDNQSPGASGSFPCQMDFASYPRLDHAFLKINPPDSIQLNINNLEASDNKALPNQLYFMVSHVENDHFAYSSDFKKPIVNFTQAEVSAGKVYFIANSKNPPTFTVSVWNGRLYCQEDCPRVATIVAPDVAGDMSISSLLIGLLSSFGTLVLLPLVKCYFEKAVKSYFSSREDTADSQVTNAALVRLWIGCCGVITHRQHEAYVVAFGHIIDHLNDAKQGLSLRKEWNHFSDRQKTEIKLTIAEKTEEVLVGGQSGVYRFFKSFCQSEATPQRIEAEAGQIAQRVRPYLSQLFVEPMTNTRQSVGDELATPLLKDQKEAIPMSSYQ